MLRTKFESKWAIEWFRCRLVNGENINNYSKGNKESTLRSIPKRTQTKLLKWKRNMSRTSEEYEDLNKIIKK